jgi:hypothetical protein
MTLVDPFIPQPGLRRERHPQVSADNSPLARPRVQATGSIPQERLPGRGVHKKTFEAPLRHIGRAKRILQGIAITTLAIVLGLAAGAQRIGEIAIAIYAITALSLRFSSRTSFASALMAFAMIMLLKVLRPTSDLAANFAVYAFLLLVVGTLSQSLEVRRAIKWKRWRRQSKGRNRG